MQLDATKEFMTELERSAGIPADPLVISTTDGPNEFRGTWVHRDVAVKPRPVVLGQIRREVFARGARVDDDRSNSDHRSAGPPRPFNDPEAAPEQASVIPRRFESTGSNP
jgi:hypothetical protein